MVGSSPTAGLLSLSGFLHAIIKFSDRYSGFAGVLYKLWQVVSDTAIIVLKGDVKLKLTLQNTDSGLFKCRIKCCKLSFFRRQNSKKISGEGCPIPVWGGQPSQTHPSTPIFFENIVSHYAGHFVFKLKHTKKLFCDLAHSSQPYPAGLKIGHEGQGQGGRKR